MDIGNINCTEYFYYFDIYSREVIRLAVEKNDTDENANVTYRGHIRWLWMPLCLHSIKPE